MHQLRIWQSSTASLPSRTYHSSNRKLRRMKAVRFMGNLPKAAVGKRDGGSPGETGAGRTPWAARGGS